ncbi:alpha-glucuronidase family glycosyl hydrolase [Leeuwenhoekiella sp. A16]|uniref:alpha-glucuronidase family glycosyl hydrolase n=1 Tax=unclassified Leeuwenhoekiella TaxID=2615029 RepID=UPI003A7F6C99
MKQRHLIFSVFAYFFVIAAGFASNGYNLWLRYAPIDNEKVATQYRQQFESVYFNDGNATIAIAQDELKRGLAGMLGADFALSEKFSADNTTVIATVGSLNETLAEAVKSQLENLGKDGFIIRTLKQNGKNTLLVTANNDLGILYGTFRLLMFMQENRDLSAINLADAPKIDLRVLNHWDNLDRTVERGYAGFSIWDWHKLPEYIDQRYIDYARANASIGINGTVLTNVNANALVLTPQYLKKVKALADVFRPYGIKVYLTARFSAPLEIGGLKTADPLDADVQNWWKEKTKEIYEYVPDFGGFLVKANSEGQPGPQNYNRTHVDGANMLADAVKPFGGIVMWRAFVYSEHDPTDRAKQAYSEFVPFDGKFRDNVLIQVKNGAIDFQPREPFHPMFGAMPKTNLMMEFQITQEYLGQSTNLVFLPKLFEEVLEADTYRKGKGSTVAKVIDGSLDNKKITGMAGVANIGTDINWTGHIFGQSNWYGFGRLAWDPEMSSEKIADEWLRATFSNKEEFVKPMEDMLIKSREAVVNYMTPLGLHHIMNTGHHYGPGPWVSNLSRPEWNPVYYHKADSLGIGFDRSKTGSKATAQYSAEVAKQFDDPKTTPENLLLWFHHLPWDYKLKNGETLWNGIANKYQQGVEEVEQMKKTWSEMKPYVDTQRFEEVSMLLDIQLKEAKWWRDACLLYFQQYSGMSLPEGVEKPAHDLEYYESLKFPFSPGIRPQWD